MTTTVEIRQLPADAKCFRLRRYFLVAGIFCAVFFSVVGVIFTVAAYWNIDGSFPRPKLAAMLFGIFFSGFTLLAVWVILAYFRERLFLGSKTIIQRGIIRSKAIDFEQVIRVSWRCRPVGASIVARTHFDKVTIYLFNFKTGEREEIVRCFREVFAEEIQDNWPRFEDFTRRCSSPQKPTSRGILFISALTFLCFAGGFGYVWFVGLGIQYLFLGVINAAEELYCLWCFRTCKAPAESHMTNDSA